MNYPQLTPSTPPSTLRRKTLTRDQSLLIHGFREAGWSYKKIADHLSVSRAQVAYALKRSTVTSRRGCGRPSILSREDVDAIIGFIISSSINRRMSYLELAAGPFRDLGVSEKVIQRELQKRGYKHHPAHKKPPSPPETMRKRREWAEAHLHWTFEDWSSILWTDETWVKDGQYSREWLTRKNDEEYQIDCIDSKNSKRNGWVFWGSFAGAEKGPCMFWEKEWGSIDSEKYSEKIVPLIDGMVSMTPWLSVMQDNTPAHACENTMEEMRKRSIIPIDWPPNSPDLNPIKAVLDWMKDYIQRNYLNLDGGRQRTHNSLRVIVTPYALALETLKTKFVSRGDDYINKFQANLQSLNEAADNLHATTGTEYHITKGQAAAIFVLGTKHISWLSNWRDLRACTDENSYTSLETMMSTIRVVDSHRAPTLEYVNNSNPALAAHPISGDGPSDFCKKCRHRHRNKECFKQHPELAVGLAGEKWTARKSLGRDGRDKRVNVMAGVDSDSDASMDDVVIAATAAAHN